MATKESMNDNSKSSLVSSTILPPSTITNDTLASESTMVTPSPPKLLPTTSVTVTTLVSDILIVDDTQLPTDWPPVPDGILTPEQLSSLALPLHALRWYTSYHLLSTFALMGLKPLHASRCVHQIIQQLTRTKRKVNLQLQRLLDQQQLAADPSSSSNLATSTAASSSPPDTIFIPLAFGPTPFLSHSCVIILQTSLTLVVHAAFTRCLKNAQVYHQTLYRMCREITERRRPLVILLAGTSGTGKSTLASLLAERLRITSVISTDSIRHTLRGQYSKEEYPHLHVSTYETDQMYNAISTTATIATHSSNLSASSISSIASTASSNQNSVTSPPATASSTTLPEEVFWSLKKKVLHGYKSQSQLILQHLTILLESYARSNQTVIIEGVHLLPKAIVNFMINLPGCIPFFIFISNELKHRERFASRSKYLTLDPLHNKYISSFTNIRIIQKYLVSKAEKLLIPCIDNTNVDRSVAAIHSVILQCMRYLTSGESLFDTRTNQAILMHEELKQSQREAWSSKRMQTLIKMKVEKKELFQRLFAQSQPSSTNPTQLPLPSNRMQMSSDDLAKLDIDGSPLPDPSPYPHSSAESIHPSGSGTVFTPGASSSARSSMPPTPLPRSPLVSPVLGSRTDEDHDFGSTENSVLHHETSDGRSPSISVSMRRISISRDANQMQANGSGGGEDVHTHSYQPSATASPNLTHHLLYPPLTTSSAVATAESTPVISPRLQSPPGPTTILHSFRLPAAASSRPHRPSRNVHYELAPRSTTTVAVEIDSEDDTPVASDDDDDDGHEHDHSVEHSQSQSSRSHSHAISFGPHQPFSQMSHLTPSLYSTHSYDEFPDTVTATEEAEEEHEHDLNMDLTILQEEDEEDSEDDAEERETRDPEDEEDQETTESSGSIQTHHQPSKYGPSNPYHHSVATALTQQASHLVQSPHPPTITTQH